MDLFERVMRRYELTEDYKTDPSYQPNLKHERPPTNPPLTNADLDTAANQGASPIPADWEQIKHLITADTRHKALAHLWGPQAAAFKPKLDAAIASVLERDNISHKNIGRELDKAISAATYSSTAADDLMKDPRTRPDDMHPGFGLGKEMMQTDFKPPAPPKDEADFWKDKASDSEDWKDQ